MKSTFFAFCMLLLLLVCFDSNCKACQDGSRNGQQTRDLSPTICITPVPQEVGTAAELAAQAGRVQNVTDAQRQFAIKIFTQLAAKDDSNFVVAPLGAFECMNLLKLVSSPESGEELSKVLGLDPARDFSNELRIIRGSFEQKQPTAQQSGQQTSQKPRSFVSKNVLIRDSQVTPIDGFEKGIQQGVDASLIVADRTNPNAIKQLQQDVRQVFAGATSGRLKDYQYSGAGSGAILSFLNLSFFDCNWASPFESDRTKTLSFNGLAPDGSPKTTKAAFMNDGARKVFYYENDEFQLIELPYRGTTLSMVLVLPQPAVKFSAAIESLGKSKCLAHRGESPRQIESLQLDIPRFSFENSGIDLKRICQELGIEKVFGPESRLERHFNIETPVVIGSATQSAYIQVDEAGTKAAAVTEMEMIPLGNQPELAKSFAANRPFMFFVSDVRGSILFAGRLATVGGDPETLSGTGKANTNDDSMIEQLQRRQHYRQTGQSLVGHSSLGGISLPDGFEFVPKTGGFCSFVGGIAGPGNLEVNYSVWVVHEPGQPRHSGHFDSQAKKVGDQKWFEEKSINGEPVEFALTNSNRLVASFPKRGLNLEVTVKTDDQFKTAMAIMMSIPEDARKVSWQKAQLIIEKLKIKSVTQFYSGVVMISTGDGVRCQTQGPKIDAVFVELKKHGKYDDVAKITE